MCKDAFARIWFSEKLLSSQRSDAVFYRGHKKREHSATAVT